jgi:hypothetical protein
MCFPSDHDELRRWREFAESRWKLEHAPQHACHQAICLGMPMDRSDFMMMVRTYIDVKTENRRPEAGEKVWKQK